jgi:1-acyl-sn-glycerol-3-phosphate acyltransferase
MLFNTILKLFFRFKVYGKQNFPNGGAVVASNHASYIDPPILGSGAPHAISYLARDSLFKNAFVSALYKKVGAIPIKRNAADVGSIRTILHALESGRKVVMFPEGTRSKDGQLQQPKAGIGYIICKAKIPVIPTFIYGSYKVLPRHRALPHFSRIVVSFGKPLYFDDIWSGKPSKEDYEHIGRVIMQKIAGLKSEIEQRYGK